MATQIPKLPTNGWNRYDYTLMLGPGGDQVLVSDDIVRDFLRYLKTCSDARIPPMDFTGWLNASPVGPVQPTNDLATGYSSGEQINSIESM